MAEIKRRAVGVQLPNLTAWRMAALLSRAELARRAYMTPEGIGVIERGGVARWSSIDRLAEALGLTRDQLVNHAPRARRSSPAA